MNPPKPSTLLLLSVVLLFALTSTSLAQSSTQPADKELWGPFRHQASVGLSAIFVDINGSRDKYRSDYNYLPGFNLSEFSLTLDSAREGTPWMDFFRLRGNGFGDAYPYQQASLSFGKRGRYDFRGRFWKQEYFFNLSNFALGGHVEDSARRVTDLRLRMFPHPKVTFELGYFRNYSFGTSFSSDSAFQDLFQIRDPRRALTQDFRIGASVNHGAVQLSVFQNFRKFKEDPDQEDNQSLVGLPVDLQASTPVRLSVPSTNITARYSPSSRWFVEGKYTFSDGHVEINSSSFLTLQLFEGVPLDTIVQASGISDRPEHRAEVNGSVDLTDSLVFSHTFRLHTFDIDTDFLRTTTTLLDNQGTLSFTDEASDALEYRLLTSRPRLELWVHPKFSLYTGYQYTDRLVEESARLRQVTISHTGFTGATWKPSSGTRFSLEFEKGTGSDTFTLTEPRDVTRWRFSSSLSLPKGLTLHPHFTISDRNNKTATQNYDSDLRQGGVDLAFQAPEERFALYGGYTLFKLDSLADIFFFLSGEPVDSFSRYKTHLHNFYSRVELPVGSWVDLRLGYRILLDSQTASFPLRRDMGEAGLALRLASGWIWDLHWAHVSYNEKFSAVQDYVANRLAATLRWSF